VIPTLPLHPRNRLARTILAAVEEGPARQALRVLAGADDDTLAARLGEDVRAHPELARRRAQAALGALESVTGMAGSLADALAVSASLFDAGLPFEVHEVLEPHWARAAGAERDALQGLIQIAVGYQHRANGNIHGARALLVEGSARLQGRRLDDLDLDTFAGAARASVLAGGVPAFPRKRAARPPDVHRAGPGPDANGE
jgi:hypothetical protein